MVQGVMGLPDGGGSFRPPRPKVQGCASEKGKELQSMSRSDEGEGILNERDLIKRFTSLNP